MELYPGWSARDNYGYGSKKKKRKKDRSPADSGGIALFFFFIFLFIIYLLEIIKELHSLDENTNKKNRFLNLRLRFIFGVPSSGRLFR
jgi:hypothetical protein